jgi:site-specific recombinase XerD
MATEPNTGATHPCDPAPTAAADLARLADVADRARDYAQAARAASTLRAYRTDWRAFAAWCAAHRLAALPAAAETVALYVADLGGRKKAATIARRLAAIAEAHKAAGHPSPTTDAAVKTGHAPAPPPARPPSARG